MLIYWLIFLLPVVALLQPIRVDRKLRNLIILLFGVLLVILVGLRNEIGLDWTVYLEEYGKLKNLSFSELFLKHSDLGYELVHYISLNYLYGIYTTNLICAIIFISGLLHFCKTLPIPWLALMISIPVLFIVVGMGYTRQSAALGFVFFALVSLSDRNILRFFIFVLLGALFHKSAVVVLVVGVLYDIRNNFKAYRVILYALLLLSAFGILIMDHFDHLVYHYVTNRNSAMESHGAFVRILMSAISAGIFYKFRKQFKESCSGYDIWVIMSWISVILLPLSLIISTVSDRIAIYFIPIQLVVLSSVPLFIRSTYLRTIFISAVIVAYSSMLFVWLNFSSFSFGWIPYRNILG